MDALLGVARKYRVEPVALSELLQDWQARLRLLEERTDTEAMTAQLELAWQGYVQRAARLSAARQEAATKLGQAVSAEMAGLALGNGQFEVALLPMPEGGGNGFELVEFQVRGLAAREARPLAKVASGGELSRISLALQVVAAQNTRVPTLIFDEVDVGIGGGVAEIVGRLLHQLGQQRQVLCVTHLPQVAARADWHWQVSKAFGPTGVSSSIRVLDDTGRVEEVARMLGGVDITETTREHARELIFKPN